MNARFRHYMHLAATERMLSCLLPDFEIGTLGQLLAAHTGNNVDWVASLV